MQEVDNFLEGFLCFVLSGYIREGFACLGRHINLRVAFAEGHRVGAAHLFLHVPNQQIAGAPQQSGWKNQTNEQREPGGFLFGNDVGIFDACRLKAFHQLRIVPCAGNINCAVIFIVGVEGNNVAVLLHFLDFAVFQHRQEGAVVNFLRLHTVKLRHQYCVEHRHDDEDNDAVPNQGFSGVLSLFHHCRLPPVLGETCSLLGESPFAPIIECRRRKCVNK